MGVRMKDNFKRVAVIIMTFAMVFTCLSVSKGENINNGASDVYASGYYNGTYYYSYAEQVLTLLNAERAKVGKPAVVMSDKLTEIAMIRAVELAEKWDHTCPNGKTAFVYMKNNGITYTSAAENIAYGYSSPAEVMAGWMNSDGHRQNMLSEKYAFNKVGIGCFKYNGTFYWVQVFANTSYDTSYESRYDGTAKVYVSTDVKQNSYIESQPLRKSETKQPDGTEDTVPDNTAGAALAIRYDSHLQSIGWTSYVQDGAVSGRTSGLRMEAVRIKLINKGSLKIGVAYRTHVQSYGWMGWEYDNALSGTSGQSKRIEAIQIKLTGTDASKYDVYYRVYAENYGWLGWAKNGESAGTSGQSLRLEAYQVKIYPKGKKPTEPDTYAFVDYGKSPSTTVSNSYLVKYTTHVQSYGWEREVADGSLSGTYGEAKRLEGIKITVNNTALGYSGGITYTTHVQTYGWQNWVSNGVLSGTSGQAKRLEAIKIKLTGELANQYDVYYRVHAQSYGWLGWAKNGNSAGTEGLGKRLEAIQIVIVPKNRVLSAFSTDKAAFIKK